MEEEADAVDVRIPVKVIDAARVERRGPANHAVDLIAFVEQQLGEIGTVLASDAGDERFFHAEEPR